MDLKLYVFLDLFDIDKHLGVDGLAEQVSTAPKGTIFWNLYGRFYDAVYHLMPYRKLLWAYLQTLDFKNHVIFLASKLGLRVEAND